MIVVANSGPLISLAKIGKVELLRDVYGTIYVPRAVWSEVASGEQPLVSGRSHTCGRGGLNGYPC